MSILAEHCTWCKGKSHHTYAIGHINTARYCGTIRQDHAKRLLVDPKSIMHILRLIFHLQEWLWTSLLCEQEPFALICMADLHNSYSSPLINSLQKTFLCGRRDNISIILIRQNLSEPHSRWGSRVTVIQTIDAPWHGMLVNIYVQGVVAYVNKYEFFDYPSFAVHSVIHTVFRMVSFSCSASCLLLFFYYTSYLQLHRVSQERKKLGTLQRLVLFRILSVGIAFSHYWWVSGKAILIIQFQA